MSALLAAVVVATASAVRSPQPKFWSASRCERVLLDIYGSGELSLPNGTGHHFGIGQMICVGSGGLDACRWRTSGHRSRLYSEFRVFTRSPGNGGVVRSWTLATRTGRGLVPVAHHTDAGWPIDFYMSRTTLLATDATPARFHNIVSPIAARLTRHENYTSGCSGGS